MNSLVRLAKLPLVCHRGIAVATVRTMASSSTPSRLEGVNLEKYNPNNYRLKIRPVTMDDMMEPYGSWKVAYERERKLANFIVARGIVSLGITLTLFYYSGVMDGLFMPNLDNIMEDTEPFNFDKEGRVTV